MTDQDKIGAMLGRLVMFREIFQEKGDQRMLVAAEMIEKSLYQVLLGKPLTNEEMKYIREHEAKRDETTN